MFCGTEYHEGFRAGMFLRGFQLGTSRQLLSLKTQCNYAEIRSRIRVFSILTDLSIIGFIQRVYS